MIPGAEAEFQRLERAKSLAPAAWLRPDEHTHAQRVADMAFALAVAMGRSSEEALALAAGARWHDAGKVAVATAILDKPGPLTAEERRAVDRHVWHGHALLLARSGMVPALAPVIALLHHERFDGSGHPFGLRGEAIPFAVRVASLADVHDALISDRPYKPAWTANAALAYIDAERGRQFDPFCVDALLALMEVVPASRMMRRGLAALVKLRDRARVAREACGRGQVVTSPP